VRKLLTTLVLIAVAAPVVGCGSSHVVIKRVSPSVVQIRTEQALGSGVVFDNDESSRERRS
jgi:hypothetical protein